MIHENTRLSWINDEIGLGVVADAFIPKGTIVWVLDELDQVLSPDVFAALHPAVQEKISHFEYMTKSGDHILCWDITRYTNHSCNPATHSVGQSFDLARRDIQAGEHFTCDYGNLFRPKSLQCRCGEPRCRGTIRADDFEKYSELWNTEADDLFEVALGVPQPLLKYIKINAEDEHLLARLKAAPCVAPSAQQDRKRP